MTQSDGVWRQIERLVSNATDNVVLVAPFIKLQVFQAIVDVLPPAVQQVQCVTRWSIAEVAAGVSDPEIIQIVDRDPRISLRLLDRLHAKLYTADADCLVGSANLTGRATGRIQPENFELLIESSTSNAHVAALLEDIDVHSVPATAALAAMMREQADLFKETEVGKLNLSLDQDRRSENWLPSTRTPDKLFAAYQGSWSGLPASILSGLISDMGYLDIPLALSELRFNEYVRDRLHEIPEVQLLIKESTIRTSELVASIKDRLHTSDAQADRYAGNLTNWLNFYDEIHTVPTGDWEIRVGREIR